MNTPAQCGVIKPPKTDIYSEAPQVCRRCGIATASLPAGNYLLCAAHRSGRTGYRELACTYHHLANTHDNIFETWCCGPDFGSSITALNETDGRALLQQTQHLKAR